MTTHVRRAALGLITAGVVLLAPVAAQAHGFTQRQLTNLIDRTVSSRPIIFGPTTAPFLGSSAPAPGPSQAANDLIYHGGAVLRRPKVYLIFWGSQWKSKRTITARGHRYSRASAIRYLKDFFAGVGGSPWLGVTTQYCQHIPSGSVTCKGKKGAQRVTNPRHQLAGVWIDSAAPAPSTIVTSGLAENQIAQDPVAIEAEKGTLHFGYDPQAVYFVFTPPGTTVTLFNFPIGYYCAYHSQASTVSRTRRVQYAFMPYVPEQGGGCRDNSVYKKNDAFGHGYYDSYSITAGHEYAEAITDPGNYFGTQDGWNDAQTSENGDKCVSTGVPGQPNWPLRAISLRQPGGGRRSFAVQPTWSNQDFNSGNKDGGCSFG